MSRKYEEQIGVRMPDGSRHMATVMVGALDSDEEVLQRITTAIGTIFNVTGTKYEVVSSNPFRLKKIRNPDDEALDEPPTKVPLKVPVVSAQQVEPIENNSKRLHEKHSSEAPVGGSLKDEEPKSERRVSESTMPMVGERWKPKDPRRKASFTVVAIDGDQAVTDDGRRVQLARFSRYERVSVSASKVS